MSANKDVLGQLNRINKITANKKVEIKMALLISFARC